MLILLMIAILIIAIKFLIVLSKLWAKLAFFVLVVLIAFVLIILII